MIISNNFLHISEEEGTFVWRESNKFSKMVIEDDIILQSIFNKLSCTTLCPLICLAIQTSHPLYANAAMKNPSGLVKLEKQKESFPIEKESNNSVDANYGDLYKDNLNGETFTQRYHSTDYRVKKVKFDGKTILLKRVSAEKLYGSLVYLANSDFLSNPELEIKEILSKRGINIHNFDLLCKFNAKKDEFKLRGSIFSSVRGGENKQIETGQVDSNKKKINIARLITNALLVVICALLVGIAVDTYNDLYSCAEITRVFELENYGFNKEVFKHFIHLQQKQIAHLEFIVQQVKQFCTLYPDLNKASPEAIQRLCKEYEMHYNFSKNVALEIATLVGKNVSLEEVTKKAKRLIRGYMKKFSEGRR